MKNSCLDGPIRAPAAAAAGGEPEGGVTVDPPLPDPQSPTHSHLIDSSVHVGKEKEK